VRCLCTISDWVNKPDRSTDGISAKLFIGKEELSTMGVKNRRFHQFPISESATSSRGIAQKRRLNWWG